MVRSFRSVNLFANSCSTCGSYMFEYWDFSMKFCKTNMKFIGRRDLELCKPCTWVWCVKWGTNVTTDRKSHQMHCYEKLAIKLRQIFQSSGGLFVTHVWLSSSMPVEYPCCIQCKMQLSYQHLAKYHIKYYTRCSAQKLVKELRRLCTIIDHLLAIPRFIFIAMARKD